MNIARIHSAFAANCADAIAGSDPASSSDVQTTAAEKLAQAQENLKRARSFLDHHIASLEGAAVSPADVDDAQCLLADARSNIKRMKDALSSPRSARLQLGAAIND